MLLRFGKRVESSSEPGPCGSPRAFAVSSLMRSSPGATQYGERRTDSAMAQCKHPSVACCFCWRNRAQKGILSVHRAREQPQTQHSALRWRTGRARSCRASPSSLTSVSNSFFTRLIVSLSSCCALSSELSSFAAKVGKRGWSAAQHKRLRDIPSPTEGKQAWLRGRHLY